MAHRHPRGIRGPYRLTDRCTCRVADACECAGARHEARPALEPLRSAVRATCTGRRSRRPVLCPTPRPNCPRSDADAALSGTYGGGGQLVAHIPCDWSRAGSSARRRSPRFVLSVIRRLPPARILVPGAGAGRLAWEIARRGHRVEAHGVSVHMLVAARSIMTRDGPPVRLFPGVRCAAGARVAARSAGHGPWARGRSADPCWRRRPCHLSFPMHAWSPAGHCSDASLLGSVCD